MPSRRWTPLVCALVALVAATASGCGARAASSYAVAGSRLTIYSSLPMQGPHTPDSMDVVEAEQLALRQAGGRAGRWRVRLVSLDDATPQAAAWDPATVSANARQAARDSTTIAYLGDFDSGASAVALPTLNEAGILQISPASGATELTHAATDAPGSPERFYPRLQTVGRSFGRLVPPDAVQARAQLTTMRRLGVRRVYVIDDNQTDGQSLADAVRARLARSRIVLIDGGSVQPDQPDYTTLIAKVRAADADAVLFDGATTDGVERMWRALHAARPRLRLLGGDDLATTAFAASIGRPAARRTSLTMAPLGARMYADSARRFAAAFRSAYGHDPGPYAAYGYEAMSVTLDAIRHARRHGNDRADVIRAFFATRDRASVLGTYSVQPSGDVTLRSYGGWVVRGDRLVFARELGGL